MPEELGILVLSLLRVSDLLIRGLKGMVDGSASELAQGLFSKQFCVLGVVLYVVFVIPSFRRGSEVCRGSLLGHPRVGPKAGPCPEASRIRV